MSDIEFLEKQAHEVKAIGHTSKFLVPINQFLAIAEKAKRYDAMPQPVKDAAELLRAGQ
jgi:hypothetical protein